MPNRSAGLTMDDEFQIHQIRRCEMVKIRGRQSKVGIGLGEASIGYGVGIEYGETSTG